jgi:hypothetical protein
MSSIKETLIQDIMVNITAIDSACLQVVSKTTDGFAKSECEDYRKRGVSDLQNLAQSIKYYDIDENKAVDYMSKIQEIRKRAFSEFEFYGYMD